MTQPVEVPLSEAAKELFAACRRELRTKAADELSKWNLVALVAVFDSEDSYLSWFSFEEAIHAVQHAPSFVLACGGDHKHLPALRSSLKVMRDLEQKWRALDKRESDAKRTIDEALQERLARGEQVLPMSTANLVPF